jgi:hypothetical protein
MVHLVDIDLKIKLAEISFSVLTLCLGDFLTAEAVLVLSNTGFVELPRVVIGDFTTLVLWSLTSGLEDGPAAAKATL